MSKVYIAGKITGELATYKEKFKKHEDFLISKGYLVMNPSVLPIGFEHHEYIHINKAMIDVCDTIYFMDDWIYSVGAKLEMDYAKKTNKKVVFEYEIRRK